MKKIISLITVICLLVTVIAVPTFARFFDVADYATYRTSVERLANFGIIGGMGDGTFNPHGELTRAQFARIAAVVAGLENEVIGNSSVRRFSDVDVWHWANGYINTAARHGLITGYPDGTYLPEQPVNFAEAATIVLRLLGWTYEDLGHNWPFAYVNKARELGLVDGIPYNVLNPISRAEIATIIDRALFTQMNARTNPTEPLLLTRMELRRIDETIILATHAQDSALLLDEVRTSHGTFRLAAHFNIADVAMSARVELILNYDDRIVEIVTLHLIENRTDDTIIFATRNQDASLASDEIRTTIGNFRLAETLTIADVPLMARVELILNYDNRVTSFNVLHMPQTRTAVADRAFGDWLYFDYDNGQRGQIRIDDNSVTFHQGQRHAFSQLISLIEQGAELVFFYDARGVREFIELRGFELYGPVVVREDFISSNATQIAGLQFPSNVRVIRGGLNAQLSDIRRYDVVYFAPTTNTLHIYTDKISGIYERAYPTKAAVSSIVLSGIRLEVETATAANRLGENPGSFPFGARFTALLGRNGGIVDVVNMGAGDLGAIAIILSTESRISADHDTFGRQEWFTTVMTGNGNITELRSDRDYHNSRGQIMRVNFNGDVATFNSFNRNQVSGIIDRANRTIGGRNVPHGVAIIEVVDGRQRIGQPMTDATARLINFSDIQQVELSGANVLHAEIDGQFGDITLLIVQNITMSQYTFGFLTRSVTNSSPLGVGISSEYTILLEGIEREFTISGVSFNVGWGPVAVRLSPNGTIDALSNLHRIQTTGNFEAIDFSRIRIGVSNYTLARDVQIYRLYDVNRATRVALSDFENADNVRDVRIYSDTSASGGLVRVITFR